MRNAPVKWLIALTIIIVVLLVILHFQNGNVAKPTTISANTQASDDALPPIAFHLQKTMPAAVTNEETDSDETHQPAIPREQIEECLKNRQRDAANLLAAFHVSDSSYLYEAASNFPGDPRVQFTVLAQDAFPEDRRKWLEAFKASSPNNALANYLSAENYFKNGNTNAAMDELLAADGKVPFENYAVESQLNQEGLAECTGKSPMDAVTLSLSGFSEDNMPMAAALKRLASRMGDLQKQFANAGDKDSVENLAAAELDLADQINNGDSGKYVINQMVGQAIAAASLRQLDQNTAYDFLDGETPAQVLQEIKDQKASLKKLLGDFNTAYPQLSEDELLNYAERMKIYGELDAMKWLVQQHQQNAPQ